MSSLNVIYHLARADFLERTRRYSFLVTLVVMVLLAYSYVPSSDAGYITLSVDGARGLYNSAWIGSLVAILTGITLPLVGFYLVKNAVERDTQTRVGQIMATTPLTRPAYTLGKWLSNFAVVAAMIGVIALATIVLQLIIGEDRRLDLVSLLAPILLVVLPTMALVSALALLFETVGWLRGGLGNIIYFFIGSAVTMASFMPVMMSEGGADVTALPVDIFGVGLPLASMLRATGLAFPELNFGNNSIGPIPTSLAGPLQTFEWAGVTWTAPVIGGRLIWVAVAALVALLAALFFNRFDPARERRRRTNKNESLHETQKIKAEEVPPGVSQPSNSIRLPDLTPAHPVGFTFHRVLSAELRLMRKGLRWWWYVVAGGLVIAGFLVSTEVARSYLLPAAWLWPILVWSALGAREVQHHTGQLVFSAARPLGRQLPATWLAGVLVTALTGSGVALNFLRAGEVSSLLAWAVAVFFIPALAIAGGIWSGSGKLFQVIYMTLWYFGPMYKILPQLDFMGASGAVTGISLVYLFMALVLLGTAYMGRRRQLQN